MIRLDLVWQEGVLCACAEPGDGALAEGFVWHLLPRHGQRPIRFAGRELVGRDNRADAVRFGRNYWSALRLYDMRGGGFAALARHSRVADGAAVWQHGFTDMTAAGLAGQLRRHDPVLLPLVADLSAASLAESWRHLLRFVCDDAA